MKTKSLLAAVLMLFFLQGIAYNNLRLIDPQGWVYNNQTNIDSATVTVEPKGAYFEYGLYLTFSPKPYHYGNVNDTFEIELMFDLPEKAIITDSWLWVGNQIVRASIIDRTAASLIYEGIVNRRRDPSILYKNSSTQYELRVFPMAGNETRKVKITYLVPAQWKGNEVSTPLPIGICNTSAVQPPLKVIWESNQQWSQPGITELPNQLFVSNYGSTTYYAEIPSNNYNSLGSLNFSLSHNLTGGMYSAVFPIGPEDGYYQVLFRPDEALNVQGLGRKHVFVFDYESGHNTILPVDILNKVRSVLHSQYQPTDSFNLIFTKASIFRLSNTWLPCDSQTIENTFNGFAGSNNPLISYSNLGNLFSNAIDFVKSNGANGEIILFTSSDNIGSQTATNSLVSGILNEMSPDVYPVNVMDFCINNSGGYSVGGQYYFANGYFNKSVSSITGGVMQTCWTYNWGNYNYYGKPFNTTVDELFDGLVDNINNFEVYTDLDSGFCYSRYNSQSNPNMPINKTFFQLGRYHGQLPITAEVSGVYHSQPFQQVFTISNNITTDSCTRQLWVGSYLAELEALPLNNQLLKDIQDTSIAHRILSTHTAFLALEPSDTVEACTTCEDQSNTGGGVNVEELAESNIKISALPNPFTQSVAIQVSADKELGEIQLNIYNLMGQLVKSLSLNVTSNTYTLNWDGTDNEGNVTASGVYLIQIQFAGAKHSLKLVKSE